MPSLSRATKKIQGNNKNNNKYKTNANTYRAHKGGICLRSRTVSILVLLALQGTPIFLFVQQSSHAHSTRIINKNASCTQTASLNALNGCSVQFQNLRHVKALYSLFLMHSHLFYMWFEELQYFLLKSVTWWLWWLCRNTRQCKKPVALLTLKINASKCMNNFYFVLIFLW